MLNAETFPKDYESPVGISLTVPNEALSIREILSRFSRGLPLGGSALYYYDEEEGDEYIPNPRHLDLADRQEFKERFEAEIEAVNEKQRKHAKAAYEASVKPKKDVSKETPKEDSGKNPVDSTNIP